MNLRYLAIICTFVTQSVLVTAQIPDYLMTERTDFIKVNEFKKTKSEKVMKVLLYGSVFDTKKKMLPSDYFIIPQKELNTLETSAYKEAFSYVGVIFSGKSHKSKGGNLSYKISKKSLGKSMVINFENALALSSQGNYVLLMDVKKLTLPKYKKKNLVTLTVEYTLFDIKKNEAVFKKTIVTEGQHDSVVEERDSIFKLNQKVGRFHRIPLGAFTSSIAMRKNINQFLKELKGDKSC